MSCYYSHYVTHTSFMICMRISFVDVRMYLSVKVFATYTISTNCGEPHTIFY